MMKIGAPLLLIGTAAANYVGTFSLVPEDQCAGACICVGDQGAINGPEQEKAGRIHYHFSSPDWNDFWF